MRKSIRQRSGKAASEARKAISRRSERVALASASDQSRASRSVTANVYYLQKLPIAFVKSRYYA